MFYPIKNPPKWMLDNLLQEDKRKLCPDCDAKIGDKHDEGCDTARCSICMGQRLGCDCQDGDGGVWTGQWPGTKEAYDWKLVVYDTASGSVMFDYNEVAIRVMREAHKRKAI